MALNDCLSLGGIIVHSLSYKGSYDYKPVSQATEGSHTMGYMHMYNSRDKKNLNQVAV